MSTFLRAVPLLTVLRLQELFSRASEDRSSSSGSYSSAMSAFICLAVLSYCCVMLPISEVM